MEITKIHVSKGGVVLGAFEYHDFMQGGFNPKYAITTGAAMSETHWWTPFSGTWVKLTEYTPNPARDLGLTPCRPCDGTIDEIVAVSKNGKLIGLKELGWVIHCSLSNLGGLSQGLQYWCQVSHVWKPIERAYTLRIRTDISGPIPKGGFEDEMPVVFRAGVPIWAGRPDLLSDALIEGVVKLTDTLVFSNERTGLSVVEYVQQGEQVMGWRSVPPLRFGGWMEQPATNKQLATIESHGITPPPGLTKGQASEWIDKLFASPEAQASWADVAYERMIELEAAKIASGHGCAGYRTPSQAYRNEISRNIIEAEEAPVDRETINSLTNMRINFWLHTFEPDAEVALERIREDGESTCFEFYGIDDKLWAEIRELSLRIIPRPTRLQVIYTLEKLDGNSDSWDDESPESFYRAIVSVMKNR